MGTNHYNQRTMCLGSLLELSKVKKEEIIENSLFFMKQRESRQSK